MSDTNTLNLGEIFTHVFRTGRWDSKNREVLYVRGHREELSTGKCYAWVQNARRVKGEVVEFGVPQRSKLFPSTEAALRWTLQTANERTSKLARAGSEA
jgi:hypothetical protein